MIGIIIASAYINVCIVHIQLTRRGATHWRNYARASQNAPPIDWNDDLFVLSISVCCLHWRWWIHQCVKTEILFSSRFNCPDVIFACCCVFAFVRCRSISVACWLLMWVTEAWVSAAFLHAGHCSSTFAFCMWLPFAQFDCFVCFFALSLSRQTCYFLQLFLAFCPSLCMRWTKPIIKTQNRFARLIENTKKEEKQQNAKKRNNFMHECASRFANKHNRRRRRPDYFYNSNALSACRTQLKCGAWRNMRKKKNSGKKHTQNK